MKILAALLAVSAFAADIPRTWEKSAVEAMELPLAKREFSPAHLSEASVYTFDILSISSSVANQTPGLGAPDLVTNRHDAVVREVH
jgi:hypothetical protein